MVGVGFVSPMKMWMSPIGMTENWAWFSLADTQRLSAGTLGKPELKRTRPMAMVSLMPVKADLA
jgi:hypothetical protein